MKTDSVIFENFADYWTHTKLLTDGQRDIIFNSLPEDQQHMIQKSYEDGAWEDLFIRNHLDAILDDLVENYNIDLIAMKIKVASGKSHVMSFSDWVFVKDLFNDYPKYHTNYIFGGLTVEKLDSHAVLIVRKRRYKFGS